VGVWSTTFIYLPHDGKSLSQRSEDAFNVVQAAGIEVFSNAMIGKSAYDMFCEDTELENLNDVSYSDIIEAVAKYDGATWFSATDDSDHPALVDEINRWMQDYLEVTGDYTLFMFGLVAREITIEDEEGEPLFQSSIMIQFDASSSPPNNQGYAKHVLASEPI